MGAKFYVPIHTIDDLKRWAERRLKRNILEARKAKLRAEMAATEDERLKDTKPMIYQYNDADRPIIVIGGGQHYRQELKEIAMKRSERPFLPNGPRHPKPHPMDTLRTIVERHKRAERGHTVHHIKSNPISTKES